MSGKNNKSQNENENETLEKNETEELKQKQLKQYYNLLTKRISTRQNNHRNPSLKFSET